jgi:hypothetical protein
MAITCAAINSYLDSFFLIPFRLKESSSPRPFEAEGKVHILLLSQEFGVW